MREQSPFLTFDQCPDGVFHFDGIFFLGPLPPTHEPTEVGVDGDSRNVEGIAQHDVRGLASDAWEFHQIFELVRDLPVVAFE